MAYLISLATGFAVGLLYWLLKVQSPAPPLIALAGLLGMVLGEHAIPVAKTYLTAEASPGHPSVNASGVLETRKDTRTSPTLTKDEYKG